MIIRTWRALLRRKRRWETIVAEKDRQIAVLKQAGQKQQSEIGALEYYLSPRLSMPLGDTLIFPIRIETRALFEHEAEILAAAHRQLDGMIREYKDKHHWQPDFSRKAMS